MTSAAPVISLIAAMADNRVIGINNSLPWRLPDDLQHFKKLTLNKSIIMGRKTWESLPGLLPQRRHIVITRNKNYEANGCELAHSIDEALALTQGEAEVFVVGGANLYAQAIERAQRMYLTFIDADIKGDAFFPQWNDGQWTETASESHAVDERHAFAFRFVTLDRV